MTHGRIPFVIYGDGPRLHSGLARIARDLAARLYVESEALGIRLCQVGVDYPVGWHFQGGWELYGFQPNDRDQGRGAVYDACEALYAEEGRIPIVLMIMDPSRCYDLLRPDTTGGTEPAPKMVPWGYFPIDSHNAGGAIGGPAAQTLKHTRRILAYGRYGAGVMKRTLLGLYGLDDRPLDAIPFLPHGLEPGAFLPVPSLEYAHPDFRGWATSRLHEADIDPIRIGCVATNQARKDLGLLFGAVSQIKQRGHAVALWLHTDKLTNLWDIGELATSLGFQPHEVAVSTQELSDAQLNAQYSWSDVTLAPGLGEGFGYPIVESLAAGTPVVHGRYAEGPNLMPARWLVDPVAFRLESCYAVQRPVFDPGQVADALLAAAMEKRTNPRVIQAYCSGSVAQLSWKHLWPRWRQWVVAGLKQYAVDQAVAETPAVETPAGG